MTKLFTKLHASYIIKLSEKYLVIDALDPRPILFIQKAKPTSSA